jgi:glycosyltransferase involved in cell wall biosynthesis
VSATTDGRLRVLTTAETLGPVGGVEVCTLQDVAGLAARGHETTVLWHVDGEHRAAYEQVGATLRGPFRFDAAPRSALRDLAAFGPSLAEARRARADVLWLNRPEQIVWAQLARRAAGLPVVAHLHHAPNYDRTHLVMSGVAHFVAVSHHMKAVWVAAGIEPDRVTVVHNAVDPARYPLGGAAETEPARRALGLDTAPGTRVVLAYGRLTASKGVDALVRAWGQLAPDPREAVLVLAGQDPDAAVSAALGELAPGSWRRLGPQADVVPLLHAADVVAMPSVQPEAFGRVLVEAMSTGRPAIATAVGAAPEVLGGEFARFLVPPGDDAALAAAVAGALGWRGSDPGLGVRAREQVVSAFPHARHLDQLEGILRRFARRR